MLADNGSDTYRLFGCDRGLFGKRGLRFAKVAVMEPDILKAYRRRAMEEWALASLLPPGASRDAREYAAIQFEICLQQLVAARAAPPRARVDA